MKTSDFIIMLIMAAVGVVILALPALVMIYVHPILGLVLYLALLIYSGYETYKQNHEKHLKKEKAIETAKNLGMSDEDIFNLSR